MFNQLTERFRNVLDNFRPSAFSESNVSRTMETFLPYLIDSDVPQDVAHAFVQKITAAVQDERRERAISQREQLAKIIFDALVEFLGDYRPYVPVGPVLFVGLQGTGKTTTVIKLAHRLEQPACVVSLDVYRPAAREQLRVLAERHGIEVYEPKGNNPVHMAKEALKKKKDHLLLFDTAGRLTVDGEMMGELEELKQTIRPKEILLVVDSTMGQSSLAVARDFHNRLGLTGAILSRADGDTRGGVAMSMRYVAQIPIYFLGVGEKPGDLESFDPKRFAERLLGGGDIASLAERAGKVIEAHEAETMGKKVLKGTFTLEDFRKQLGYMEKMGGLGSVMRYMPSAFQNMPLQNTHLGRHRAILNSMTKEERQSPHIIHQNRKRRIARGSGTRVSDVDRLLKQFSKMQAAMKNMGRLRHMRPDLFKNLEE